MIQVSLQVTRLTNIQSGRCFFSEHVESFYKLDRFISSPGVLVSVVQLSSDIVQCGELLSVTLSL